MRDTRWVTIKCLALAGLFLGFADCRRSDTASQATGGSLKGHNLLVITLDTTRADRIGCYGHAKAQTPTLDALAKRGTLFENATSQVPMTLPSHISMFTSSPDARSGRCLPVSRILRCASDNSR